MSKVEDDILPMSVKIANLVDMVPLSDRINAREKVLKLASFTTKLQSTLRRDYKVKAPIDTAIITLFFVVCSYLPSLFLAFLLSFCTKPAGPSMDPALFVYNQPDRTEINTILKTV